MNQEQLADRIEDETGKTIKRQTVAGWENGKPICKLEQLAALCHIFDCEMGYLLCEDGYNHKTRTATDISKATGLTPEAVKTLSRISSDTVSKMFINDLLSDTQQLKWISQLYKEFRETLTTDEFEEIGVEPFSSPPGNHCEKLFAFEAKDFALYRFNNAIISFAREQEKKSNKREK